jgi:hypothetical protein
MNDLKIGFAMLTTNEYKELILKEKELDDALRDYGFLENENRKLTGQLAYIEEELKELLLILTDNKERASYMEHDFSEYDLADKKEIAKYINKNYMKNGVLKFRKVEETKEEETNE